jgi:hypothetical protein
VYNAGGGKYVTRLAWLNRDWTAAHILADSAPGAPNATPTTLARDGSRLLWVNSQLDAPPGHSLGGPTTPTRHVRPMPPEPLLGRLVNFQVSDIQHQPQLLASNSSISDTKRLS